MDWIFFYATKSDITGICEHKQHKQKSDFRPGWSDLRPRWSEFPTHVGLISDQR
jgi:hypothetical protein